MNKKYIAAVIGGGAAGIAAAISCSEKLGKGSTVIIEKQSRIGRKLLATGNGRCNISNNRLSEANYHGDKKILSEVLSFYTLNKERKFLSEMGLILRDDNEGRLYPYSNRASTVLDCFRYRLNKNDVTELCDFHIISINKENEVFRISSESDTIFAKYVIFATGSPSSPSLGADETGYKILDKFGIKKTPVFPSLSPVFCKEKSKILKGVRAKGKVFVIADGKIVSSRTGEIQFTENGLSGICVFDLSRNINEYFKTGFIDGKKYSDVSLSVDLMPEYNESDIVGYLRKCRSFFADRESADFLSALFDRKLSSYICTYSGINNKICNKITENEIKRIAGSVKNLIFTPEKISSYNNSQVCAGGYDSRSVFPDTLMCRKINNLFICGELLDVDGDCGGYNLHFSIGSGLLAARSIK